MVENTAQAQRSPSVQRDVEEEEQAGKQRSHGQAKQGRVVSQQPRVEALKAGGSEPQILHIGQTR